MKIRCLSAALLVFALYTPAAPAAELFGTNKDMVQLQTQVQQLLDAVARLQQSNDERMGVLKDLVQQSADSVNRLSVSVDTLQKQLAAQQAADGTKSDTVSGQVQALNDSLDEIKARMGRLEKALNDVQNQTQTISAAIQNGQQPAAQSAAPSNPQQAAPAPGPQSMNSGPAPIVEAPANTAPVNSAPPVADLYRAAYNDYIAAKYGIATSEFLDVIKSYPDNNLAGNAYYYIGEIDYRAGKFSQAAKDYDKVLEQFPDSNKTPAAHLHKGEALIQMRQNDAGVRELRALIQRFPVSPEATQARSKLNAMGVAIHPRA